MSSSSTEPSSQHVVQAVTGVVPPSVGEAKIRTAWPTVLAFSKPLGNLGAMLIRTRLLAPLAWLVMAPLFMLRIMPVFAKRYVLTNRRITVRRGLTAKIKQEVALADIDEISLAEGSYHPFFHSADLEIKSKGKVVLTLLAVPEPQGFRHAIMNAITAWVPEKSRLLPMQPASEMTA